MTKLYGGFSAATMQQMDDIVRVDISFCFDLNACDFVQAILGCIDITKLEMVGCKQFTEYNIVDICTSLPNLEYFDARACSGLQYVNAYVILTNARKLKQFKVNMKFPEYEKKDWLKLKFTFPEVSFGEQLEKFLLAK